MNNKKRNRKMEPYKKEPKVTYAIRLSGYDTVFIDDFTSLRDARINRINLIKNARKSNDKWFKGKTFYPMVPYKSNHRIRNEWMRMDSLKITRKTVRYSWDYNYLPHKRPGINNITECEVAQ